MDNLQLLRSLMTTRKGTERSLRCAANSLGYCWCAFAVSRERIFFSASTRFSQSAARSPSSAAACRHRSSSPRGPYTATAGAADELRPRTPRTTPHRPRRRPRLRRSIHSQRLSV
ncbi:unnamed protein product [Chrysodeixis includens]|uniref:Uncharacterized protein n=1 Tax=Chrysodeixis includens TaxID=689277 RepID=A0A9N8L864_CHRIL|nr:unnamed protein product [Chrysodeixis includens]